MVPVIQVNAVLEKIFELDPAQMRRKGNWLWWLWIFYFDEPRDKPKQVMVLWSTRNEKKINCNGLDISLRHEFIKRDGAAWNIDGAVAAWYYDGRQMRENYLLNHADVLVEANRLGTKEPFTEFSREKNGFMVSAGDLQFQIGEPEKTGFYAPDSKESVFLKKFSYDIFKINRVPFESNAGRGTAYFQRVRINAPVPPWYWGLYHFEGGGAVHYYQPHLGASALTNKPGGGAFPVKKHFQFWDGRRLFDNRACSVRRVGGGNPAFIVESDGAAGKAKMLVESYSHACWAFRKGRLNRLDYNEYPALVKEFSFRNASGKWALDDLGQGRGNSEHATGFLW